MERAAQPPIPIADCPTCAGFGIYHHEDLMAGGPSAAVVALIGDMPYPGGEGIERCARCGSLYRVTYTCGFGEHDIELQRVSPTEVGAPTDVVRSTELLSHRDHDTRDYAALTLVDHYLDQGAADAVIELLRHSDAVVRIRAVVTVLYRGSELGRFLPTFLDLMFDEDGSVRGNAGRIRDYHPKLLRDNKAAILAVLKPRIAQSPVPCPDAAALVQFLEKPPG